MTSIIWDISFIWNGFMEWMKSTRRVKFKFDKSWRHFWWTQWISMDCWLMDFGTFSRGCRVLESWGCSVQETATGKCCPRSLFAIQAHVGRVNVLDGQGQAQGLETCCDGILQPGPHVSQDLVAAYHTAASAFLVYISLHNYGHFMIDHDRSIPWFMPSTRRLAPRKNIIVNL